MNWTSFAMQLAIFLIEKVMSARQTAMQRREWDDAQEAEFQAWLVTLSRLPHWQPETPP